MMLAASDEAAYMATRALDNVTILPLAIERAAIERVERILDGDRVEVMLVGRDGEQATLPPSLLQTLRQAARTLAHDRGVIVASVERQLTTQQAADLLGVSRPYLIRLLEDGMIPFSLVGAHRRIRSDDLMDFKRVRDAERATALDELAAINQDLGLYDVDILARLSPPVTDEWGNDAPGSDGQGAISTDQE